MPADTDIRPNLHWLLFSFRGRIGTEDKLYRDHRQQHPETMANA